MKKRIIAALVAFVMAVSCFVVQVFASDDDISSGNVISLGKFPVISTSNEIQRGPSYFYSLWQNNQSRAVNGMLKLMPIVKYGGDWCILVSNNVAQSVTFGYDGEKVKFNTMSVSLTDENYSKYTCFAKLEYNSKLYFSCGYDYSVVAPQVTPISIRTGSAVSASALPTSVAWIILDSDYTDSSQSAAVNYFQGKNIHNSDLLESANNNKGDYSSNSARISSFGSYDDISFSQTKNILSSNCYKAFDRKANDFISFYSSEAQANEIMSKFLSYNSSNIAVQIRVNGSLDDSVTDKFFNNGSFIIRIYRAHYSVGTPDDEWAVVWNEKKCYRIQDSTELGGLNQLSCGKTYTLSVDLAGFVTMSPNDIYLIQVVDCGTLDILTSYPVIYTGSYKTSGSNSIIVQLEDDDYDYNSDSNDYTPDDNGNLKTTIKPTFDGFYPDTNDDFNIDDVFGGLSISDLTGVFQSSLSNASAFFQLSYNVIPQAYMSIIVAGAAILIILRILSR